MLWEKRNCTEIIEKKTILSFKLYKSQWKHNERFESASQIEN